MFPAPNESKPTQRGGFVPQATGFGRFTLRVIGTHAVTYTIAGLLASNLLDYRSWWESEYFSLYKPFDSFWVAAGPALQVIRGLVFAAVLYPFRGVFLEERHGWGRLWALLVGIGILSTWARAAWAIPRSAEFGSCTMENQEAHTSPASSSHCC
jgi:hypothetical protein